MLTKIKNYFKTDTKFNNESQKTNEENTKVKGYNYTVSFPAYVYPLIAIVLILLNIDRDFLLAFITCDLIYHMNH